MKILTIGNSFSVDSMEYVYQIAKATGIENIELGNLYISGCDLVKHLNNARNNTPSYTYYINNSDNSLEPIWPVIKVNVLYIVLFLTLSPYILLIFFVKLCI